MEDNKKLYAGFITYGELTSKYLPYFLPSLKKQNIGDFKIIALDNSEEENNENKIYIKNNFPEINFNWNGKNLGFAKAFNIMIRRAIKDSADYFMAINPDMIFEPDMLKNLVQTMKATDKCGAVGVKILKWNFENNKKTNIIDSLGLAITKENRFYDAHQGEADNDGTHQAKEIFGFTGAAVLLNLKALQDVAYYKEEKGNKIAEYFDELMFMYKEDCDLSYRLRLAGWKIMLEPAAIGYHNRTAAAIGQSNMKIAFNRKNKSKNVKRWSFLNQWVLFLKLKNLPFSWNIKIATGWYQFKSLIFVLLFEQYLLKEFFKLGKLSVEIKKKREQLKVRVDINEIEKFMF